jgi:Asp-tRNA(Asn)/Glu-tRNA(Gln) amidotransferase A subunit family amidase
MDDILRLSLVELTETIRNRKASPVELMEAVISRIEETNLDLNAVVLMRDREALLADAAESEKRIMKGEARPLEGIPFGVKDLEDVKGLITSFGSVPFRDQIAESDSTQVARLRAAGGIVIGKTNTPEFGYTAITKNLVYGVTRSPWNLELTPGGSSGGSAAALTACVLPLVTGSDGGGSIRIPSSFTGAFGLKPSFGRIPTGPRKQWSYSDTSVHGPITKTVEDAALFMDQVVGFSPCDPNSLPHPGISYLEKVRKPLTGKLRIGYSLDLGYAAVQSDVASVVEDGIRVFEKIGHRVERFEGGPPEFGREWGLLGTFELASALYPLLPEHESKFGRSFLAGVKTAWNMTPEWWGEAAQKRSLLNDWCAEIFDRYDLLLTPTVPYDPPPAKGPFPDEIDDQKYHVVGVASFTIPFNLSWHPAATVRVGFSKLGLPVGLQIAGQRHCDDLVLQAARAFEAERPWHPHWPISWER